MASRGCEKKTGFRLSALRTLFAARLAGLDRAHGSLQPGCGCLGRQGLQRHVTRCWLLFFTTLAKLGVVLLSGAYHWESRSLHETDACE